jgi:shikimate dehydrogenase
MKGLPYAEVIGDPVGHSKSPAIHKYWLKKLGLEGDYRHCRVPSGELAGYFEARSADPDWRGCNITMPHKLAALDHVHKQSDPGLPAEPINIAVPRDGRIEGMNSDTNGLMEPLLAYVGRVGERRGPAIVVGAGGVLHPAMSVLAALGYGPIWIVMRDDAKAARIAKQYQGLQGRPIGFDAPLPPANLLVNASPLGMTGFPPFPLSLDSLAAGAIVFDLIYDPLDTALLQEARARGLRTIDGLDMLIAQAAVSFQCFFGAMAPRRHDIELREHLTR